MASSKSSLALVALFAFGMFRSTILSPGPAVPRRSALVPADGGKPQVHRVEGLTYLIEISHSAPSRLASSKCSRSFRREATHCLPTFLAGIWFCSRR